MVRKNYLTPDFSTFKLIEYPLKKYFTTLFLHYLGQGSQYEW